MKILSTSFHPDRVTPVKKIIVHHTGSGVPIENELAYLSNHSTVANYHYVIDQEGKLHQIISNEEVAYHAGESLWGDLGASIKHKNEKGEVLWLSGLNPHSIGIALHSDGYKYTHKQRASAFNLIVQTCILYGLNGSDVIRHCDITQIDKEKCLKEVLVPHTKDSLVMKECRKWDVGLKFINWYDWSWAGYQKRINKELAKYKKI